MRQSLFYQKSHWRLAAAGLLALAIVLGLFTIAPAREAMAQFLGIFRVRKFALISIDQAQVETLENVGDYLDSALGEPEFLRAPGDPLPVIDVAAAEAQTGFDVLEPGELPEGAALREVAVAAGPHLRLELTPEVMQTALAIAGVEAPSPPLAGNVTLEADVPAVVTQEYYVFNPYGSRDAGFTISQAPSPELVVPDGVDPLLMGELLLRVLGLPAEDAQRLAQSIDWTTTMVMPFPVDVANAYEVEVKGASAVLIEEKPGPDGYRREKMLLWEQGGMLYSVQGQNLNAPTLKQIADSLR